MKYYVAILEMLDAEKDKAIRGEHLEYLDALIEKGKIFGKGPFEDGSGGMVIFLADSYEEAEEMAINDPVIKEGTRKLHLREWRKTY